MAPPPSPSRPPHRERSRVVPRAIVVSATLLLLAGASLLSVLSPPGAAEATVTPAQGFRATVLGWSSWYGSYRMGSLGEAWCIDHGLHAPDPAFVYVPTSATDVDVDAAAAISWIVTAHGGSGPVDAAAVMLAVHDLRRASYPFGVLNVDTLTTANMTGFGGHEAEIISRARSIKTEGLAHRGLRAPFRVTMTLTPTAEPESDPAGTAALDVDGRAVVTVTDAGGRPVVGAGVALAAEGATIDGTPSGPTAADGSFVRGYRLDPGPIGKPATVTAHAIAPNPIPATYASSTRRAQRVVRGSWLGLRTQATTTPPTSTSTSTSTTSTSTTSTSTTSTSTTSTSSSTTSTSTTSTTTAPSTTVVVPVRPTIPPTTTSTTSRLPAPPANSTGTLPRTGARTAGWALIGAGLVLLGTTLVAVSRGWLG